MSAPSAIIDAKSGVAGVLVDLATGQPIRKAFWANLATGEYKAWRTDPDGRIVSPPEVVAGRTQLKWLPTRPATPKTPPAADPDAPPVQAPTLLAGRRRVGRPLGLMNVPCDQRTCSRWAVWQVADELDKPALVVAGVKQYEQADLLNVRYYCDWHYQPPRLFDAKGEIIKEHEVEARPG